MPTIEGREEMRLEAIDCYEAQTWPNRELVIVEDPGTVGLKRNIACNRSEGEYICHWDDDDWSHPDRIFDQIYRLLENPGYDLTGYSSMRFKDAVRGWWLYDGIPGYALGTSLFYPKKLWVSHMFADTNTGEDLIFVRGLKVVSVPAGGMMWARIHENNTSKKNLAGSNWSPLE